MEATATPQALQQDIDPELFGNAIKEFAEHLNLHGNERIMFKRSDNSIEGQTS